MHTCLRKSGKGDLEAARRTMAGCRPERVVEHYARFSQLGGLTRGEQGLVVSMNTRWIPHYVRFRQQLGTEPVRYNFAATSHDLLAQSRGVFTFQFDPERGLWQTLGTEETGAAVFSVPQATGIALPPGASDGDREICRSGIESDQFLELAVAPIMRRDSRGRRYQSGAKMPPGRYRLTLLMLDPTSTGPDQRVFDVHVSSSSGRAAVYRFQAVRAKHLKISCSGNSVNSWNSIHEISCAALLRDASDVRASGAMQGYEAAKAIDGRSDTRWAVEGELQWIQLPVDPAKPFDHLAIDWYQGDRRTYAFELSVSEDGKTWTNVDYEAAGNESIATDRIDVVRLAGGGRRVLKRAYDLRLDAPGVVQVRLVPVRGNVLVCGLELAPVATTRAPAPAVKK